MGVAARIRRIVGLGLCALDHLLLVDEFLRAGPGAERLRYRDRLVSPGGMVGTAVVQAAMLGAATEILSVVGEDDEGRLVARSLRESGVATRRLRRSAGCPTSIAYVLVRRRDGERRFVVPDRRGVEGKAPGLDLAPIRAGTLLLVDGHYPRQALAAVTQARACGGVVVGDFSDARPAFERLLPFVDYPIVPTGFVRTFGAGGPRETLFALRDRYGGTPVVTEGARGALVLVGGRVRRVAPHRVRVRDTTGAGDAFHGAFAAALHHGQDLMGALAWASRAAAAACTALGGRAGLMNLHQLQRALRSRA